MFFEVSHGVKNFGQTPAYNFQAWTKVDIFDIRYPIFEKFRSQEMSIIGPSATRESVIRYGPIQASDLSAIREGLKAVFVWGRIDYVDAFEHDRHFEFYDQNGREILLPGDQPSGRWSIRPRYRTYQAN